MVESAGSHQTAQVEILTPDFLAWSWGGGGWVGEGEDSMEVVVLLK